MESLETRVCNIVRLTLICSEVEQLVGCIDGVIGDISTFVPAHTLLTETPCVVGFLICWKGTAFDDSFGLFQLSSVECLWRWEGGEEGGSEEVMEGAHCSIVMGRGDT